MNKYQVKVGYDDGMNCWRTTLHVFVTDNDEKAVAYIKENEGKDLSLMMRGVSFDRSTLSRIIPV